MPKRSTTKALQAIRCRTQHGSFALPLVTRHNSALLPATHDTFVRQHSNHTKDAFRHDGRQASTSGQSPSRPSQYWTDRELINTSSLSETIEAHRKANEENAIKISMPTYSMNNKSKVKEEGKAYRRLILQRDVGNERKRPAGQRAYPQRRGGISDPMDMADYAAEIQPLQHDWQIVGTVSRYLRLPWMRPVDIIAASQLSSARHRLKAEIEAADHHYGPTPQEKVSAEQLCKEIADAIVKIDPRAKRKIDLIGSRAAGHASCSADLDLNLVLHDSTESPKAWSRSRSDLILQNLYPKLRRVSKLGVLAYIYSARVPIIIGVHPDTGLSWQLQSSDACYGTLELMKSYRAEFPVLTPLFRVLQQVLKIRGLVPNHVGARGISSYPLISMIVASIKLHSKSLGRDDLVGHLLKFLHFWARFDTYTQGITHVPNPHFGLDFRDLVRDETSATDCIACITQDPLGAVPVLFNPQTNIPPFHRQQSNNDFHLVLHDPANPFNDLGHRLAPIKHMQATFLDLHTKLQQAMHDWDSRPHTDCDAKDRPSLLAPLLEADHTLWNLERKRLTRSSLDNLLKSLASTL